ncbi:hypothetical protein JCM10213_008410 [Rhodosporidiobolus nylandii]
MSHELSVEGEKVLEKDEAGNVISSKDYTRVHAGYVAASHNKRFPEETRHTAEQLAHDLAVAHGDEDAGAGATGSSKPQPATGGDAAHHVGHLKHDEQGWHGAEEHVKAADTHADEVHQHRVAAGYKAALKREGVSEEAKQHAREKLEEMGIHPDA